MENISNISNGLENSSQICIGVLDKLAPQKKKDKTTCSGTYEKKSLAKSIFKKQVWSQQNYLYQATQLVCKSFEKNQKAILRKSKWKRRCW